MKSLTWISVVLACLSGIATAGTPAGQQPTTGILGVVYDAATAQTLRGVTVEVDGMPDKTTQTGLDGLFQIVLPAGTYTLRLKTQNCFDQDYPRCSRDGGPEH